MNVSEYTYLMNKPDAVNEQQTAVLEKIVQEFPYFQSARALYLKGLYNQNSFKYNYALKIAAAHTTDRSVLFDFITSDTFTAIQKNLYESKVAEIHDITVEESEVVDEIPKLEPRENNVEQSIVASIKESGQPAEAVMDISEAIPEMEPSKETPADEPEISTIEEILEPEFVPVEEKTQFDSEEIIAETISDTSEAINTTEPEPEIAVEDKLEIGKPLAFSTGEKHSFQEWLQLSKFKPIVREEEVSESEKQPEPEQSPIETEQPSEVNFEKQKKNDLIDKFIETNPRIPHLKHDTPLPGTFYESSKADNSILMTETLARVYLEQKKYQKAIQAYEILILKYPEKSSFFADRILDIKNLQQNNT